MRVSLSGPPLSSLSDAGRHARQQIRQDPFIQSAAQRGQVAGAHRQRRGSRRPGTPPRHPWALQEPAAIAQLLSKDHPAPSASRRIVTNYAQARTPAGDSSSPTGRLPLGENCCRKRLRARRLNQEHVRCRLARLSRRAPESSVMISGECAAPAGSAANMERSGPEPNRSFAGLIPRPAATLSTVSRQRPAGHPARSS